MVGTLDLFFHWKVRAVLQVTVLLNLNFWWRFLPFICVPFIGKYYSRLLAKPWKFFRSVVVLCFKRENVRRRKWNLSLNTTGHEKLCDLSWSLVRRQKETCDELSHWGEGSVVWQWEEAKWHQFVLKDLETCIWSGQALTFKGVWSDVQSFLLPSSFVSFFF